MTKTKVLASVPAEAALPGWQMGTFSLCPYLAGREKGSALAFPLVRALILLDQGFTLWPHLTLMASVKAACPTTVTLGIRASTQEFREIQFSP